MSYPQKLGLLREARERVGLKQGDMARLCGLQGQKSHQTAGYWERGEIIPSRSRRRRFIGYLWDHLRLREDVAQFERIWEVLTDEWDWEPLSDTEWTELTKKARPSSLQRSPEPVHTDVVPAELGRGDQEGGEAQEGTSSPTALPLQTAAPIPPKIPFQAPALTPHFVGRTTDLAQLCAQMQQVRETKVYALVGMGGIGKSSLAVQLAHALRPYFADGVLWASASSSSPLDIINLWAQEYDCDFSGLSDLQSRAAALRSLLAPKRVLLILDDVSQVTQIQPLLPGAIGCVVLVTTRSEDVAVGLGAQIHRLHELALPDGMALLSMLLGAARVEREREAAQTICQQLECLPLALEIVGQLLHVRSQRQLGALSDYLDDVSHRLSLQISDRAVRTSFLASWDVLDDAHKRTFSSLGVFAGRVFSAEAVAHVTEVGLYEVQDHLYTLVALSLVRDMGDDRFQQHPLLAGFAAEQLGDAPSREYRMAQYYEQLIRHQDKLQLSFDGEWESVFAGMQAAHRLEAWPLVLGYGASLCEPWFRQARFGQARTGLAWMNTAAIALADRNAQAYALQKWGYACLEQDDYQEAATLLVQSIDVYTELDQQAGVADCLYWLARLAIEQGNYADAQQHLESCHQVYEELNNATGLARTYHQQSMLAYHVGELGIAQKFSDEAYQRQLQLEDKTELLPTLRLLADVAIEREDFAAADRYCEEALTLAQALHHRAELAAVQYCMAVVARCRKELTRALAYCEQASTLFERMGDRAFFALTLYERSKIDGLRQQVDSALQWGHQSLTIFQELQDDFNQVYVLHQLGQLSATDHRRGAAVAKATARQYWQQGHTLAQRYAHPLVQDLQVCLEDL